MSRMMEVEVRKICAVGESKRCNLRCSVPLRVQDRGSYRFKPCDALWHDMTPARGDGLAGVRLCRCGALYEMVTCDECRAKAEDLDPVSGKACEHRIVRHSDGSRLCLRCGQETAAEEARS